MSNTQPSGRKPRRTAGAKPVTQDDSKRHAMAPPAIKAWMARPLNGREARLGFVATDDRGCNSEGLFPNTALIVQPCEEFAGIGIYQLFAHGKALVRRCRQVDENLIEIKADGPTRGGVCVYLPIEQFEEQVCGLVLGQIQSHNDAWMADLCAKRTKFDS